MRKSIHILGIACLLCFALRTACSYGMVLVSPAREPEPAERAAFHRLAAHGEELGGGGTVGQTLGTLLRGETRLQQRGWFVAAHSAPTVGGGLAVVLLLVLLSRNRMTIAQGDVHLLFRWAVVFAVVSIPAVPVLTQDFWLSPAWGRMIVQGQNPYYESLTPAIAAGLPLDAWASRMTYGPLWALLSAAIVFVSGSKVWLTALLFKLVLAAAWIGSLALVQRLVADRTAFARAAAMLLLGWMPLGLIEAVSEGHNDIVMVCAALLWLACLRHGRPGLATVALAASALLKYVTLPLFLLDLLHHVRARREPARRYAINLLPAAALALIAFLPFYRSLAMFQDTAQMANWHFFTPAAAVVALGRFVDLNLLYLGGAVSLLFVAIAVGATIRFAARPAGAQLNYATLALLAAALFGLVGHVWPWFVLWALPFAVISPATRLARFVIAVALPASLLTLPWVLGVGDGEVTWVLQVPAVALYGFAILWLSFAPVQWFNAGEDDVSPGLTDRQEDRALLAGAGSY